MSDAYGAGDQSTLGRRYEWHRKW